MSNITKKALASSLKKILSKKEFNKITINDITEDCGVNRQTFYYHFKDIYDLMEYRMEREMKRIMEETMSQPDPEKALTQLYMYIMENQKHIRALSESVQFMALRRQMGEKVYQYFYNHLERIGMFKNLTMPEAAMAVQIIIFSVMGVAFDAPFKDEADVKERVATFMSVIRKCTGRDPMQVR